MANKLVMASMLSSVLVLSLGILLATHVYFVFSSSSSVESGGLVMLNPFFESQYSSMTLKEYMNRSFW